jgi:hypothetical protein
MLFLKNDLRTSIAKIQMDNGENVQSNIFAQITFQKINTELTKEMKNILITGFNSMMSFYVLKNGKLD